MGKQALIVEDPATMRKIVMRGVRQAEIEVGEIHEANEVVAAANARDRACVDLILADVSMPSTSGLEFVEVPS